MTIKVTTVKSFLALLVFLYTDTVPTDMTVSDYRELLVVADRFCLTQLISVCEAAITERIGTEIKKKRLNSVKCNDVINLLLTGQVGVVVLFARYIKQIHVSFIGVKCGIQMHTTKLQFVFVLHRSNSNFCDCI